MINGIPSLQEVALMPSWQQAMWLAILGPPPPPPFTPTFEDPGYVVATDGSGASSALNKFYFATEETATKMMELFDAAQVVSIPYLGVGGVFSTNAEERWLVWSDGIACNAGILAAYYTRNPEDRFPNVAKNAVLQMINSARMAGQQLPGRSASPATHTKAKRG
jgi:hypothetical protein